MQWHYSGELAVHSSDGWDIEQVSGVFDLPDRNVELIRNFLYSNREFILGYKYNPPSGEAPWGDVSSQTEMRSELNRRLSDDEWADGVADKQVKAWLVAFYHQMLNNIDLYSPDAARELVAV